MNVSTGPAGPATFLDALVKAIRAAGMYNRNDQAPPAAVLWTDKERQWEPLLPQLRQQVAVLTLGGYAPGERTGPAYWIRCMIARTLPEDRLADDETPIVYLPGYSRQDLRAVEECPAGLKLLVEIQYRCVLWTQKNGRDWTIAAFLQAADGGLGIEVSSDAATREALKRTLCRLVDEPIEALRRQAPIRAPFLDTLLNPDEVRSLLRWLNDPQGSRSGMPVAEWESFRSVCKGNYSFDPQRDGALRGAELLGGRSGPWEAVWQRFEKWPLSYPNLPALLRQARPTQGRLFERSVRPQDNEQDEATLRGRLLELGNSLPGEARDAVLTLEQQHGWRRESVWGTLGQAPLAVALQHLAILAAQTERPLGGVGVRGIGEAYARDGWRTDVAVLDALAAIERAEDVAAVGAAISALYRPWLEDAAVALQQAVASASPGEGYLSAGLDPQDAGACIIFSDGLRYDLGRRLAELVGGQGLVCEVGWRLAALPSVTATAKPAVSPVAAFFRGGSDLSAAARTSGSQVNAEVLRRQLVEAGYQVLRGEDTGDPSGRAWTELGAIDAYGHEHGWRIAHHAAGELRSLSHRIVLLIEAGWPRVVVVTDHGWLLLPGGLPKVELPEHLTETRKGRCARLKENSTTDQQTVPWYWDAGVRIAVAPGICCYEAGKKYEHGGLSPQECVVPMLTIFRSAAATAQIVTISSVIWRGLRCSVSVEGSGPGVSVDLRTRAADAGTSISTGAKTVNEQGAVSLPVPGDDRNGEAAVVVVLSTDGNVLAQSATIVGG